ncbi:hypothetical protein VSR34_06190 [Paraburkholderia sp. JHI2823]|uniref:hypothetical protein n=1 Tax=Paraburkholderia TaxID=1822464 RepID=UPI000420564A|nr:hypothetical protein [Paraburkholderia mimosarum]
MGSRVIGPEVVKAIADAFLDNTFDENGRSAGNVAAINEVDSKSCAPAIADMSNIVSTLFDETLPRTGTA